MNPTIVHTEPAAKRRQVWPSVTVWAVASTLAAAGLLAAQPATGLSMEVLSLVMLAPGIGAAIAWLTARRRLPDFGRPVPSRAFAAALGLSLAAVIVYFLALAVLSGGPPRIPAEVAGTPVAVMVLAQALGALTEELGFRGVLFHALAGRMSRLLASLLTGLGFALWHVHYFALPPLEHAAFIAGTVALTVTMTYVMTGSLWQRMTVCTVIHLGANLALAFTSGEPASMLAFGAAMLLGCAVVAPLAAVRRARSRRASAGPVA